MLLEPVHFSLPNRTVECLELDYTPFHWNACNLHEHQSSFWVSTSEHDRQKRNFEQLSKPFFDVLELISPRTG